MAQKGFHSCHALLVGHHMGHILRHDFEHILPRGAHIHDFGGRADRRSALPSEGIDRNRKNIPRRDLNWLARVAPALVLACSRNLKVVAALLQALNGVVERLVWQHFLNGGRDPLDPPSNQPNRLRRLLRPPNLLLAYHFDARTRQKSHWIHGSLVARVNANLCGWRFV